MISGTFLHSTLLFHSNLSSLQRKFLSDVQADKMVLSSGARISKIPLDRGHWWLLNKERKSHFLFVERRLLAATNCTGSADGALVPVLLLITHGPTSGLPVSPPGFSPPSFNLPENSIEDMALIPLELQPTLNTSRRKAREAYLIHRSQTLEPNGMNRRNER